MGMKALMFGTKFRDTEQTNGNKERERSRYGELLKKGMKPSEALHVIASERGKQREAQSMPSRRPDKYSKQYSAPKQRGETKPKRSFWRGVAQAGAQSSDNIRRSGMFEHGSVLDFSRTKGSGSFLDFSRMKNESIFGESNRSGRRKYSKKHSKRREKTTKRGGKTITIRVS